MADETPKTAKTAIVYDASGAQKGAEDAKAAADKVIAAVSAMDQAETKSAEAVTTATGRKTTARSAAARAAQDAARLEAAAASAGGDAVAKATDRIATSLSSQTRFLNSFARSLDPLGAAAQKASNALQTLLDIQAKGSAAGAGEAAVTNAARASDMIAAATNKLLQAQSAQTGGGFTEGMQRLQAQLDPAGASVNRMVGELRDLNALQAAGVNIVGGYANAWNGIVEKYDESAVAAKAAAAAQREMIESARAANAAAQASGTGQSMYNQFAGVNESAGSVGGRNVNYDQTKSAQDSAAVFQAQFAAEEQLLAENKALEAEFNPLKTATDSYNASVVRLQQAQSRGLITAADAVKQQASLDQRLAQATTTISKYGQAHTQADFATRQFGVQSVQFFTSLQAGQPFMTAFIQQGHQVLDVALATGTGFGVLGAAVKQMFSAVSNFISANPFLVLGALITAVIAGMVIAAESASRRLSDLTQQLRVFTTDYKALAASINQQAHIASTTTTLSTKEATQAGQIISTTANAPDQNQLQEMLKLTADIQRAFAIDVAAAAHKVAQAFDEPAKAADELAKTHFPGMTAAIARNVELLVLQGRMTEATTVVLNAYKTAVGDASREMTPMQRLGSTLGHAFEVVTQALGGLGNAIVGAIQYIDKFGSHLLDPIFNLIPGLSPQSRPAVGAGGTGDLLSVAQSQLGQTDTSIGAFLKQNGQTLDAAQTAWCAAFVNAALKSLGIEGTGSNVATSFLNFGQKVDTAQRNDILVQARGHRAGETGGHVGIATGNTKIGPGGEMMVEMTSGNQNDRVQTTWENAAGLEIRRSAATSTQSVPTSAAVADRQVRTRLDEAQKKYESTQPGTKATNDATIAGLVELQQHVEAGSKAYDQLTVTIGLLRGATENSRTPTEAYSKTLKEQSDLMGVEGGAARALAEIMKAADEANVAQTGHHLTAAEKVKYQDEAVRGLNAALQLNIAESKRETDATKGSIDYLVAGTKATDDYNATVKARKDALAFGARDTDQYNAALKILTAQNIAAADATRLRGVTETAVGNDVEMARTKLRQQIDELKQARDAQGTSTEAVKAYNIAIDELSGKLATARTPAEEQLHTTQLAGDIAGKTAGATRELAAAIQELNEKEIARTGHGATQAQIAELTNAKLREYAGAVKLTIDANARLIVDNNEMAAAMSQGGRAIDAATAAIKARAEALKAGPEGSAAYLTALRQITQSNIEVAQSERDKAAATDVSKLRDEIDFTNKEIDLLNASVEVRTRELAILRARQSMQLKPGDMPSAKQQEVIDLTVTGANLGEFQKQTKTALDDVTGMFSQSFDTIGTAITDALVAGQGKAIDFRNVMVSVAQQILTQFMKLAVLNPLMNELFPGSEHRSTITDLLNATEGRKPANDNTASGIGGIAKAAPGFLERGYNWLFNIKGAQGPTGDSADTVMSHLRGTTDMVGGSGGGADVSSITDAVKEGSKSLTDAVDKAAPGFAEAVTTAGPDIADDIRDAGPDFASSLKAVLGSTSGGDSGGSMVGLVGKAIGLVGGLFGGGDFMTSTPTAATEAISAVDATSATGLGGGFLGGMKYHGGGVVGLDGTPVLMPAINLNTLPRFHEGMGGDEFAAILQKGERVLTTQQQQQVAAAANSNESKSNGPMIFNFSFPANSSPDSFRRAGQQVANNVSMVIDRAKSRNGGR